MLAIQPMRNLLKLIVADLQTSLSHAEMLRLYRSADVYVSSFRSEGFGLGTLEALALGLQARYQSITAFVERAQRAEHTCECVKNHSVYFASSTVQGKRSCAL